MDSSVQDSHLEHGLLQETNEHYTGDGSVDSKGKPALKSKSGNWRASIFILGTECGERLAYYGIATNLVTYLTTKLHLGNASAATNVTTWSGTCYLTPLIAAFLADAYWGRYWTIVVFCIIHFIGMSTLTLSASVPAFKPAECVGSVCPSSTPAQYAIFFSGLYLMALGTGGIKTCVSAFGADQFDDTDPRERIQKGSFFNWFYVFIQIGSLVSSTLIVWIQENSGWGLGFGIPMMFMVIAVASFFIGTPLYRCQIPGGSPLTRICQVLVASLRKCKLNPPQDSNLLYEKPGKHSAIEGSRKLEHTDGLRFLDKATILSEEEMKSGDHTNAWRLCTVTQVEELKILIRMLPIWVATVMPSTVYAQMSSLFVEQGKVMDTTVGPFTIPAASMSMLEICSALCWVILYEKVIVPIARKFTGKDRGFSDLQRIGIGLVISTICMIIAALLEMRRLKLAKELGLVHQKTYVPIKILWQIPQYVLIGAGNVFSYVGKLEFFYNEAPDAMRSLCTALHLLISAAGFYMSSLILTIVTYVTTASGKPGWIPDNLNEGHLDSFFWLLAGLSLANLFVFAFCAINFKTKNAL